MFKNKQAFSLTELMMVLLIASLLIAASVPILTKKHFKMPSATNHGAYICYYGEDGKLYENRYNNRFGATSEPVINQVKECIFNPPQKAAYYQISAVGGGGGGGDSGYTGGNVYSGWTNLDKFGPFGYQNADGTYPGLTEQDILNKNISLANYKSYGGQLWAFARGIDSGRGGDIDYIVEGTQCTSYVQKQDISGRTPDVSSHSSNFYSDWSETKTGDYTERMDITYTRWYYKTTTYDLYVTDPTDCSCPSDYPENPSTGRCEREVETCVVGPKYGTKIKYCCKDNTTGVQTCYDSPSGQDACVTANNSNYSSWQEEQKYVIEPCNCSDYPMDGSGENGKKCKEMRVTVASKICNEKPSGQQGKRTEYVSETKTKTVWGKPSSKVNGATNDNWKSVLDQLIANGHNDIQTFDKKFECEEGKTTHFYRRLLADGYSTFSWYFVDEENNLQHPSFGPVPTSGDWATAGRARQGAFCIARFGTYGQPEPNITLVEENNINAQLSDPEYYWDGWENISARGTGDNGGQRVSASDYHTLAQPYANGSDNYDDGWAYCYNVDDGSYTKRGGNGCPESDRSYSIAKIIRTTDGTEYVAKAFSAWKGGLGGKLNYGNVQTDSSHQDKYNDPVKDEAHDYNVIKPYDSYSYYNDDRRFGTIGSTDLQPSDGDGHCEGTSYAASRDFCENIGEYNKTGYCLIHNNSVSFEAQDGSIKNSRYEPFGEFRYRYSYDENYVQYGNPGAAGELKTIIIRSFKDMDTTIHLGRGGIAGEYKSGSSGSDGSATYMGSDDKRIIYVEGGKGGKGSIIGINEVLKGFQSSRYQEERKCFKALEDQDPDADFDTWNSTHGGEGVTDFCSTLGEYKYIKRTGKLAGGIPTLKGIASNLFNYVVPQVKDNLTDLFNQFGIGGKGGGITHKCWAGQWIVEFEKEIQGMDRNICPRSGKYYDPNTGTMVNCKPTWEKIGCHQTAENGSMDGSTVVTDGYTVDAASDGKDGALMIKW